MEKKRDRAIRTLGLVALYAILFGLFWYGASSLFAYYCDKSNGIVVFATILGGCQGAMNGLRQMFEDESPA